MFGFERWAKAFDEMHADVQRDLDNSVAKLGRLSGDVFGADSAANWFFAVPSGVAYALATFTISAGKGLVDVLRLGEGVKSGTVSGIGQDGLRLLNVIPVAGMVGRGVGVGSRALMLASAARAARGGERSCGVISSQIGLQLSGTRALITAEEVANLAGKTAPNSSRFSGMYYHEIKTLLQGASTSTQELNTFGKGITEIESIAAQGRGPVVFGAQWGGKINGVTQPFENGWFSNAANAADHWMVAFRNIRGQVVVADQFGVRAISQAGTISGRTTQFTVTSRALLVGNGAMVRSLGRLENFGQSLNGNGARSLLASSLAIEMIIVNTPTMEALDSKQREQAGKPQRSWTTAKSKSDTGNTQGTTAPPSSIPKPNIFSPTLIQDAERVLSKIPFSGTREVVQLQIETGLSANRVENAVLQLIQSGLVRAKVWSTTGVARPAWVERALSRSSDN